MCKTCHPNQPKLTKQEIQIIIQKSQQNKNPKPKRCTKECAYCQKVIERKNYFLNQQTKKESTKNNEEINNDSNNQPNINTEEKINIKETIEYLNKLIQSLLE